MEIYPKDFIQIVRVTVLHDGLSFMCEAIDSVAWRCGKCGRGVLLEGDKACRVCRSQVDFARAINWERVGEIRRHNAEMEWRRTHPRY